MTGHEGEANPPEAPFREATVYLRHVLALFWPGSNSGQIVAHPGRAGDVSAWDASALSLLIDEGRRQVDRQRAELDRIQSRAQFLFTAAAALLAAFASQGATIRGSHVLVQIVWGAGLVAILLGLLGAAALMSAKATFGAIDANQFSHENPADAATALAQGYANVVPEGANTVATRITVLRDSVFLTVTGALIQGGLWTATTFL